MDCVAAIRKAIDDFRRKTDTGDGDSSTTRSLPKLSCKIRLFEDESETVQFAKALQQSGCERLGVHCRKRSDKHNGLANLEVGRMLATTLSIPVIINGMDVVAEQHVLETLERTQAQAIMIARNFLSNPRLLAWHSEDDPAEMAAEYLECCKRCPPPSALYIRNHFRWIFRDYLEPLKGQQCDYSDWKVRLWTFMVRPYIHTLYQFRLLIALYVKLNGSTLPASLQDLPGEPSFKLIRHAGKQPSAGGSIPTKEPPAKRCKMHKQLS